MNRTAARAILTILLLIVVCRAHAQTVVYTNDFETAVTTGWSTTITRPTFQGIIGTAIPRNGGRFLGEFGDQTIRLDLPLGLTVIPPHDTIRVVFDLYVIQTWDGNVPTLRVRISGALESPVRLRSSEPRSRTTASRRRPIPTRIRVE